MAKVTQLGRERLRAGTKLPDSKCMLISLQSISPFSLFKIILVVLIDPFLDLITKIVL